MKKEVILPGMNEALIDVERKEEALDTCTRETQ